MEHLRAADSSLAKVIDAVGPFELGSQAIPYATLHQHLEGAAARTVERRLGLRRGMLRLYGLPKGLTPKEAQGHRRALAALPLGLHLVPMARRSLRHDGKRPGGR